MQDIAGLVRTIYDALGSSIKVPHYGSKTIKVKLTVSPDKRDAKSSSSPNPQKVKFKKDLNVTIRESARKEESGGVSSSSNNSNNNKETKGTPEKDTSPKTKDRSFSVSEKLSSAKKFHSVRHNQHLYCYQLSPELTRHCSSSPFRTRRKFRERSSSLQRQELLEIIQANMEKNNLSFQTSR